MLYVTAKTFLDYKQLQRELYILTMDAKADH